MGRTPNTRIILSQITEKYHPELPNIDFFLITFVVVNALIYGWLQT